MEVPSSLANKKFWVVADLTIKDQETLEKIQPLVAAVKESTVKDEPNCHHYHVLQNAKDGLMFTVVEQYENGKAFEDHCNTQAFKTLFADTSVFTSVNLKFLEELM